jgi:prepilin-type N-terminal cleavage/methylation domain-containing protein
MQRCTNIAQTAGYTLVEVLLVLAILAICLLVGSVSLVGGLRNEEARGTAQSWQAAAAWAQVGVLWHGGAAELVSAPGSLTVLHDFGLCGGGLGSSAPLSPESTNMASWRDGDAVSLRFGGALASPSGGGSIFFKALQGGYRVTVRPESGLTTRARVETVP